MMRIFDSKLIWVILTIAILGDFIVAYILSPYYPGYSHTKQVMSVLGNPKSPVAGVYNIWLIILGLLFIFSAVNFYKAFSAVSKGYALIGFILLLVFAIGAGLLSGMFSVNEDKEVETLAAKVHGIGAGLGFIALTFIPLVVSILLFKSNDQITAITSLTFFFISLILFVLFILSEKEIYENTILGLSGLWQRLLLASMYMPLLIIAIKRILEDSTK